MKSFVTRVLFLSFLVAIPAQSFAAASSVSDALGVAGNKPVTRAEFLRAGVIVLKLPVKFGAVAGYDAYPEDLRPYVRSAVDAGAFDAFGDDPDLSATITRGEAVRFVAELRSWDGTGAVLPFRDVPAGTALEAAVRLSAQRSWMAPLRQNVFGAKAFLRAKEATAFLTRAATDAGVRRTQTQTIKVSSKRKDPIGFNSKKFRDQIQNLLRDEYLYADKLGSATGSTAKAFVESIKDPYTTLFDPTEAKAFHDQLGGTVTGIGVHLDDEYLEVMSVIDGSPAERAGMKAGDRIVSVNKKRVEGLKFDDVIGRIRGREGTPVRVVVRRGGEELTFDMIRAAIEIPDSEFDMRSGIAIVTVSQFGDHLIRDAEELFDDVLAQNPTGIVLDLRFNPGGYLQAVPSIVGEFLPSGSVYLYTRGRSFEEDYVTDTEPSVPSDLPLVVLTNGGSASSAEIVAGALQDHDRATIVGEKTFGKGTVQTVVPFANKSNLKFTIAEWLTPDRHPIDDIGITPDVEVAQSDAGDAQLEKALEIVRAEAR